MKLVASLMKTGLMLCLLHAGSLQATELDYPVKKLDENVGIIFGPLELPNEHNQGFRNNVVIIQTSSGVVIFDPGGSASAGEMVVRKVKSLTDRPVVAAFISHAHGDHWLGSEVIKKYYPNATIYGHKNAIKRISGADGQFWLETINKATKGTAHCKKAVAPDKAVKNGDVISVGDTRFRIHHTGKAHTDNDIMIEIIGKNMIFTGDVVRNEFLGLMEEDASFDGNIKAIDFLLSKNYKTYIPAHGRVGTAEIARAYRGYLQAVLANVRHYYADGMADFEMKGKILPKVKSYKDWAGFDLRFGPHISRAYLEVENEAF